MDGSKSAMVQADGSPMDEGAWHDAELRLICAYICRVGQGKLRRPARSSSCSMQAVIAR